MQFADRVQLTTTTTGTGTYTLGSAATGFQTFADVADAIDGSEVYYCCTDDTNWEIGKGVLGSSQTTLTRAEILDSSTGSAIDWASGDKTLFNTLPASVIELLDLTCIKQFSSDPSSPVTNQVWLNTTDSQLKIKTASATVVFDAWNVIAD